MATTKINSGQDVVTFLKAQHEQIKALFEQVASATGSARQEAFDQLRRLLAVHETAEEQIVHPRAKRELPEGEAVVGDRLEEEHKAKEVLAELEKMQMDSTEFETKLRKLQADVIAHAEAEEHKEFERLAGQLDEQTLERMRKAVEVAEKTAPTHPHPKAGESAIANTLAGPFASMMDRAKDMMTGRK
jgi:hemerythrin superfamily protein